MKSSCTTQSQDVIAAERRHVELRLLPKGREVSASLLGPATEAVVTSDARCPYILAGRHGPMPPGSGLEPLAAHNKRSAVQAACSRLL